MYAQKTVQLKSGARTKTYHSLRTARTHKRGNPLVLFRQKYGESTGSHHPCFQSSGRTAPGFPSQTITPRRPRQTTGAQKYPCCHTSNSHTAPRRRGSKTVGGAQRPWDQKDDVPGNDLLVQMYGVRRFCVKRRVTREHLEHEHAEGVPIHRFVARLSLDDLRCQVVRCATKCPGDIGDEFGGFKVSELDVTISVDEDIFGLKIAIDDVV